MKKLFLFFIILIVTQKGFPQFSVSPDHHYLLKDGKPFYWLGDTGWELFHRLTKEEADQYFKRRSEQGFTVIQAVVLAEMDGLHTPNAYGDKPLIDDDPTKPNEAYFKQVDFVVDRADQYNLNVAMLPTWADKINKGTWGKGPEIFNTTNAKIYGAWIGNRYKSKTNIIWVLGGDRNPRNEKDVAIWNAMGEGIMQATNNKAVITYHPQPCDSGSATWFHRETWLAFNMFQNGHCRDNDVYNKIQLAHNMQPTKPVIDGESLYEDHPVCFNVKDLGKSSAYDIRKYAYLDVFAGAFGNTYGCHDIWQMYSPRYESVNGAAMYWQDAMNLPGANQMQYVRRLIESHPMLERVPDQSLIVENDLAPSERIQATRGNDYAFIYTSEGKSFTVILDKIAGATLRAYWYNPRDGKTTNMDNVTNSGTKKFTPPSSGYGQDWVLVIDDAEKYKNML
ncbi:MAG: glycoside hydrolase family 140 protein [Ginsengibacter sp.]